MTWNEVLNAARFTEGLEDVDREPSSRWKYQMLLAEHSPIRLLKINYTWKMIKYWVSVHLVRHNVGCVHFVRTQRSDKTNVPRDSKPQGATVSHRIHLNAQSCINISRKRLCSKASKETREAWIELLNEIGQQEPELSDTCVPECVYRGFCPEGRRSCGYATTTLFKQELDTYHGLLQ